MSIRLFIPIIAIVEIVRIIGIGMAGKPGITNVYQDMLPVVDAMSADKIDPAIEQQALAEAQQQAAENPVSKEEAVKIAKESTRGRSKRKISTKITPKKETESFLTTTTGKKLAFYRKAFLTGYKNLLALYPQEATIARLFGIRENIFSNIRQNGDKGVKQAYEKAMDELEPILMAGMLRQALGFEYVEIKTTYEPKKIDDSMSFKKNLKPSKRLVKTKVEETKKYYPGRPQLFLAFMATHFPEKWKIKGTDGAGGVHFHIDGDLVANQISDLAGKYLTAPVKVIDNEIIENPDSE